VSEQQVVDILRQALMTTFWLSMPLLMTGFLAGAIMSLVQILTSIQDSAFGTVPRLAAFLAGLMFFLPWMLMHLINYTTVLIGDFSKYAR